jgi:NTE family protein
MSRRGKVAFVLSGGGPLGGVQVGMLRALVENGVKPDMILGCSVGAVNGAAFASEPNLRGIQRLEHIWGRLADGDPDLMENARLVPAIVELGRKGEAISTQDNLRILLEEELAAHEFADLDVPFACVATDMETAGEYWFTDGDLIPAVLASSCLPGVYPPVELEGRRLYDGGVSRELPVQKAAELGATDIYVLHVGHLEDRDAELKRPYDALVHAYWASRIARLEDEMAGLDHHVRAYRLPAGDVPRLRFDDFSQSREIAEKAYQATAAFLTDHAR